MLCLIPPEQPLTLQLGDRAEPFPPAEPSPPREELRHLIIGSQGGVRSAIHQLHALHYAEQAQWSQLITIPASGLLITRRQGEVLSFLLRHRQLS